MEIRPTGQKFNVPVVIFVTLRDGFIAGAQLYWDRLSALDQLEDRDV